MGEKACFGARAEQVDFEPVHRLDPGDQIVGEHLDGRHRAGLEKRLEDHEGLCGIVRVVAGLEVAGDDVVLGAVEERVDVPEAGADLLAGPQFARHAEGVAEHHAGQSAGDSVFNRHVLCVRKWRWALAHARDGPQDFRSRIVAEVGLCVTCRMRGIPLYECRFNHFRGIPHPMRSVGWGWIAGRASARQFLPLNIPLYDSIERPSPTETA